nr:ABC transporter substrate-binding protein [Aidingimonas lacisalsi]
MTLLISSAQARTLDTAFGDVEIEGEPQRVVTLYEGALDVAMTAGVTPVAAIMTRGGEGVARYLKDRVGDIAIVGTARETNIEAVVAQSPDVILASPRLSREQYALLADIAPTVVPRTEGFSPDAWKGEARLFGRALGHETEVDVAIEEIERRAEDLAESLQDNGQPLGAHLVRWMPQGPLVMSDQLFSTGLLAATGFDVDDGGLVPEGRPHSDPLSLENLAQVDNDWLFMATLNEDGDDALASARESKAFGRLSAVEQDRVVPVDGQLWTSASGPMAASAILDDIEANVLSSQ